MPKFIKILRFIVIFAGTWVFGTILGKGGLLYINSIGYHPENWIVEILKKIEFVISMEASAWILSGLFGLILLISEIRFKWLEWIASKKPTETIKQNSQTHEIRDWNILNAIEWWEQFTGFRKENEEVLELFSVLRQMARDGAITVWGRANSEHRSPSNYTEPLQEIPKEHWGNHDFDTLRYVYAENEGMIRDAATPPGSATVSVGTRYVDLRLTSQEVKEKWPESNSASVETVEDNQKAVSQNYNLLVEHKEGHPDYQQLDITSDGSRYWTYRISILKEEGDPIDNLQERYLMNLLKGIIMKRIFYFQNES